VNPTKVPIASGTRAALCGIIILYLLQQAVGLDLRWVEDETWYLLPAENLLREGRMRIPTFNTSDRHVWNAPPLLILIEAGSWCLHEMTIVQARLVPVACGLGTVLLTFLLGRRLVDDRVGLVGAFLVACDNLIFLTSRTVRPDIMVTFFTLLSLWLLLKSIQEKRLVWTIAAGAAIGAGMSTHPNGAVSPLCGVLMLLTFEGWQALRQPRLYLLTAASTLAFLPYFVWTVMSDAANNFAGIRSDFATQRGRESSFLLRIANSAVREVRERFRDFVQFPFRVHVGVLTVGALVLGALSRNRVSRFLVGCVLTYLLFFIVVTNYSKNVRYLNSVMPFVALLWAQGIVALWSRPAPAGAGTARIRGPALSRFFAVGLLVLAGLSQIAGNFYYHWKYRSANIAAVCRQIDSLIPAGSTVYGGMVFWAGLHQGRLYVPYQRMPWQQAIEEFNPTILILDDRIMVAGSYPGEFDELRAELHDYVDAHGKLLGQVPNDFYGELKIYEVASPEPAR
jgi:4-amino-4-deoxy-L-arabinose transferase-like glycosyltransferase